MRHMLLPQAYLGNVITLCVLRNAAYKNPMAYHGNSRVDLMKSRDGGSGARLLDRPKSTSRGYVLIITSSASKA